MHTLPGRSSTECGLRVRLQGCGGASTIGNLTVKTTASVDPSSTLGNDSAISAEAYGVSLYARAGTADGSYSVLTKVAARRLAGISTVGTISSTVSATIAGATTGTNLTSGSGVRALAGGFGTLEVYAGNAGAYNATAGTGSIAYVKGGVGITGKATASISGVKTYGSNSGIEGGAAGFYLHDTGELSAGNGYGSSGSLKSAGIGAAGKVGGLYALGTTTVSGTTAGNSSPIYGYGLGVETRAFGHFRINVGTASGYTATAGSSYVGTLTGNGYSSVTGTTGTKTTGSDSHIRSVARGLEGMTLNLSNAYTGSGSDAKSVATAGSVTVGGLSGSAKAYVTGTTSGTDSAVYTNTVEGITNFSISAGNATKAYTAAGGAVTIGAITGSATVKVTGTTSGTEFRCFLGEGNRYPEQWVRWYPRDLRWQCLRRWTLRIGWYGSCDCWRGHDRSGDRYGDRHGHWNNGLRKLWCVCQQYDWNQ